MTYLNLLFIACAVAVNAAQRIGEAGTGGYGLLRPGYSGYNTGYNPGYAGYEGYGYPGYQNGYPSQYGGYGGTYGSYPGGVGYNQGGNYPSNYGGLAGYPGYGQANGYPASIGGRPGYRPGYNTQGQGYPGYNFNRPGFNQFRPVAGYPGGQGNFFGGYGDGYNNNFRYLGRKADIPKAGSDDVKSSK